MMRGFGERCGVGLCRQKINPAINLKCIRANDFRANFMRDVGRQFGFPGCSWTNDEEGARHQAKLLKANRETRVLQASRLPIECISSLALDLMFAGLCATHHEPAAEEFFVVQFLDGAFCFFDGSHLHKGKSLRALVMPITHDLRVLHVPHTVEQLEEIALGGVEGQVADVKTRRGDFDPFRFSCRPGRLRTVARDHGCLLDPSLAVSKKRSEPLPECLFLNFRFSLRTPKAFGAPAAGPAARTARASPG